MERKNHHQGPEGYHTQKATWEAEFGKDHEFLAVVADMLAGELTGWPRRKSCCEVYGHDCNQGRNCPARKGK